MFKRALYPIVAFFAGCCILHAQLPFSHEIGIISGPVAFQSDYGERNDLSTNAGNTGFGIGIVHYMNFSYLAECNCYAPHTYVNDHFKWRTELSWNKTDLQHFGRWVDKDPTSPDVQKLRAMRGRATVFDIGGQLEYFPLSIRDYQVSIGALAPYVSFGIHYSYFTPDTWSELGPLGIPQTTIPKYLDPSDGKPNGFSTDDGNTWSIVWGVGARYKVSPLADMTVELRWQSYFSNWVDGLNPDPNKYPENRANDWNVWFNVGYVYYLDFANGY